jgi:hypothetical protein
MQSRSQTPEKMAVLSFDAAMQIASTPKKDRTPPGSEGTSPQDPMEAATDKVKRILFKEDEDEGLPQLLVDPEDYESPQPSPRASVQKEAFSDNAAQASQPQLLPLTTNWKKFLHAGAALLSIALVGAIAGAVFVLVTSLAPAVWGIIIGAAACALVSAICFGVAAVIKKLENRAAKLASADQNQEGPSDKVPAENKKQSSYVDCLSKCFKFRAGSTLAAEAAASEEQQQRQKESQTYAPPVSPSSASDRTSAPRLIS